MMPTFAQTRRLSLGFHTRCLLAFVILLATLLTGVATPGVHAQQEPWEEGGSGGVQVSLDPARPTTQDLLNLNIRVGETESYYLRLTAQPTAPTSNPGDRWWVMVHVDGQKRPNNQDDPPDSYYKGLSWQPPLGREFSRTNWDDWVDIRITAHEDYAMPGTSVIFKHEVWDHTADCPVHTIAEHQRRSGWVRVNIIAKDGNPPSTTDPPGGENGNNGDGNNLVDNGGNGGNGVGSAVAPTVTIGAVASVEDDATLALSATVSGGTYDTLTYAWSVVSGGGSILGTGASVTYTPPDVSTNTVVEVSLTVTARGTGTNAQAGTSDTDTETDTEPFTVIPAGTDPLDTEGHGGNNLVNVNTGTPGGGGGTNQPRQLSSDATLQNLELKDGENDVPLDPAFTSDNTKYAASVESHVTQVTVIPTPTHPQAQVTYLDRNNRVFTDASDSNNGFQVETVAGDTVINVKVTAEDGSTMETYRVTVTRPPSSDATLRNLVLSHGTNVVPLTPGFTPETKAYTANVPSDATQVTPTPNHAGAQIMYLDGDDGMLTDANTGEHGFQVEMDAGDTVIKIKVTAEDGTIETYRVTVTRLPSSDATLRDLIVKYRTTVAPLSPRFMPGTTVCTTAVDSTVTQVTVMPIPTHPRAQFIYLDENDQVLMDANTSETGFQVDLPVVGDNVIKVKVTAENGGTMRTYMVTVTRVVGLARDRQGVGHEWLARFARTVGTQIVNVVGERFVAPRRPGLAGQVAGQDFSQLLRTTASPEDGPARQDWAQASLDAGYTPRRPQSTILTGRDFLTNTAFSYTMGQEDGFSAALWGRGAVMEFDGRDGDLLLDGEVSTGMLGVDYARGAVTGGLLVSLNRGEGDYESPTGKGTLDSMLVGVYPYARVEVSDRISAWGLFGHGRGKVTLAQDNLAPISTDIGLHMGALGVDGKLSDASGPTGLNLTVKSDAMFVKIESDEVVRLDSTHANVSRLRLMLEGMRVFEVALGATLTPTGQVGYVTMRATRRPGSVST